MIRRVVISGCSGGGKSTLVAELARRGHLVFEEPGRRVVAEELATGGQALPWVDGAAFAARAIELAVADHAAGAGTCFYDRSVLDALIWFERTGTPMGRFEGVDIRYHPVVYLAPPWPEIYVTDAERRHGFEDGVAEYEALLERLPTKGYETRVIPKASVAERADWIEEEMAG